MPRESKGRKERSQLPVRRGQREADELAAAWDLWKEPKQLWAESAARRAQAQAAGKRPESPATALQRHFRALLEAFNAAEVRYLVFGDYAFVFHAELRPTAKPDVWIDAEPENVARLWRALEKLGVSLVDLTPADFADPRCYVRIGEPAHRIVLVASLPGITFAEAWKRRSVCSYPAKTMTLLGLDDMIATTHASKRPQDRLDRAILERFRDAKES